jgi:cobalt/nickel transport system permease protein
MYTYLGVSAAARRSPVAHVQWRSFEEPAMHIPDGYLSPATCGVMYAASTPFWGAGVSRVGRLVRGRAVPQLAMFAAFSFAIMMFNVPVPGGTTAHGVGGTLVAIVLGPWAAVITTSVALIIQALFFGDGGITAIGANCFNMAIVLPFVGYLSYRLLAGRSSMFSQRRVIAAAIGSYLGITVAALAVGIELGLQPHFWSSHGVPNYSPYGFATAIPAMLLSHAFGASFVEAAITALGLAYLQRAYPQLLPGGTRPAQEGARRQRTLNPLIPATVVLVLAVAAIVVAGLVKSGGSIQTWAGLDWSMVDWQAAGGTLLVSAIVSAIVLPLIFFGLRGRRGLRTAALIFAAIVIWVPIGLIAPGGAFAEDQSVTPQQLQAALDAKARGDTTLYNALPDVNRQCGCVPNNINDVKFSKHTVFSGYQPPWVDPNKDAAWKQNLGYQFAGLIGFAVLAAIGLGLFQFSRWLLPAPDVDWRTAEAGQ